MKRRDFAYLGLVGLLGLPALAAADTPDKVNIAIILSAGIESGWDGTLIQAFERVKQAKPHGLDVTWQYTDPLWGDEAGDAMRIFAETGTYDIIWAHSSYSDQVAKLKDEFPEIMFVVVGSGNTALGGNQYWVYKRIHEASYLLGQIAGGMTKSGVLGVVGTFAADDVNDEINAFFAGARSVRGDITQKVAFIESWYDPAKALEMTQAQISTGADLVFQLAGNFKPCEEAQIYCFANFNDDHAFSETTILSSALSVWDPDINWILDEWWTHKTEGKPYNGNTELRWFGMAEGGSAIAPFHGLDAAIPEELKARVAATQADIISGAFTVPLDVSAPVSN